MSFKKIIIFSSFLAIFGFLFNFNVPTVKAVTAEELLTQIKQLQAQILLIQKQLTELQGQPAEWCHDFNANIKWKDTGSEVETLQIVLEKEGFQILVDEKTNKYFYTSTLEAVMAFQGKYIDDISSYAGYRIDCTGFVGSGTRSKLNELYGCGVIPACQYLWWYDNTTRYCSQKQFCGVYMYLGLQTFKTQAECNASLNPTTPSITVISPNGGETWKVGETRRISWTSSNVNYVRIYIQDISGAISGSGVVNYVYDGAISASTGYYDWTIQKTQLPGYNLTFPRTYKIRIDGLNSSTIGTTPAVTDMSDNYFTIQDISTTPSITVISPNGGEEWAIGNAYNIKWQSSGLDQVEINLYDSSDNTTYGIADNIQASLGNYSWINLDIPKGSNYRIQINGNYKGAPMDQSDNYFSIVAATTACTDSDRGKNYYVKGYATGAFVATPSSHTTANDFCLGGPQDLQSNILVEYYCGDDSYVYSTHYTCSYGCQNGACVSGATDSDNSPDYLKNPISYAITPERYPDLFVKGVGKGNYIGGGTCLYGTEPNPTYCKSTTENYTTYYDHCATVTQLNEAYVTSDGKLGAVGTNCPNGCKDGACISTSQPSITVISPNGGEVWKAGESRTIYWEGGSQNKDNSIRLIKENVSPTTITNYSYYEIKRANNLIGTEKSFTWSVGDVDCPTCVMPKLVIYPEKYKVRIIGPDGKYDDSDSSFVMLSGDPAPITVISPNGGEKFQKDAVIPIQWKYSNPSAYANKTIRIELWKGANYLTSNSVNGTQTSYNFNSTGLAVGDDYYIWVVDTSAISYSDESDNYFSIVVATTCNSLVDMYSCLDNVSCYWDQQTDKCYNYDSTKQTCSDPDGGKNYNTQAHTFGFRTYSSASDPSRDLRIRTGGLDACISSSTLREHYCTDTYYINTIDVTCPSGTTCQNGAYVNAAIIPPAPILSPAGGEAWQQGKSQIIKWTPYGNVNSVMISLYKGGVFQKTLETTGDSSGQWTWNIPVDQPTGSLYSIRVSRLSYPSDFIADSNYFSIVAATTACTDSDSGLNYNVKGTVTYGGTANIDVCSVSGYLFEQYCLNGNPVQVTYLCPNGCQDGACLVASTNILNITKAATSPSGTVARGTFQTYAIWDLYNTGSNNISITNLTLKSKTGLPSGIPATSTTMFRLVDEYGTIITLGTPVVSYSAGTITFDSMVLTGGVFTISANFSKTLKLQITTTNTMIWPAYTTMQWEINSVSATGGTISGLPATTNPVTIGSGVGLIDIENQLANISKAISALMEQINKLLGM